MHASPGENGLHLYIRDNLSISRRTSGREGQRQGNACNACIREHIRSLEQGDHIHYMVFTFLRTYVRRSIGSSFLYSPGDRLDLGNDAALFDLYKICECRDSCEFSVLEMSSFTGRVPFRSHCSRCRCTRLWQAIFCSDQTGSIQHIKQRVGMSSWRNRKLLTCIQTGRQMNKSSDYIRSVLTSVVAHRLASSADWFCTVQRNP